MMLQVINNREMSCNLGVKVSAKRRNDYRRFEIFKKNLNVFGFQVVLVKMLVFLQDRIIGEIRSVGIKIGA